MCLLTLFDGFNGEAEGGVSTYAYDPTNQLINENINGDTEG